MYDIEAICLHYFNVYGSNQRFDAYGNVIPIFVFQLLAGEQCTIFGDGEQTRDFVSVDDVVQAKMRAATASDLMSRMRKCFRRFLPRDSLVAFRRNCIAPHSTVRKRRRFSR